MKRGFIGEHSNLRESRLCIKISVKDARGQMFGRKGYMKDEGKEKRISVSLQLTGGG